MGQLTNIAWTDSTLNTAWGCTKVSAGCQNCYMFRLSKQFGRNPEVVTILQAGFDASAMRKAIKKCGEKVFVNSMSDTFHESINLRMVGDWFNVMAEFPEKQFQVLTKRINRARLFAKVRRLQEGWPANVWLGTSVEDQHHLFRIQTLRNVVGPKIKFVSFEPLVGPISSLDLTGIQWVIVGGESDKENPRAMEPSWANYIRHICEVQKVPFFFKQMGGVGGDGAGGDILFGRQYHEFPDWTNPIAAVSEGATQSQ